MYSNDIMLNLRLVIDYTIIDFYGGEYSVMLTPIFLDIAQPWEGNIIMKNKQIMIGLEGNRQICLPREIQDLLPKCFY